MSVLSLGSGQNYSPKNVRMSSDRTTRKTIGLMDLPRSQTNIAGFPDFVVNLSL
jgi:hypothetical protein